MMKGDRCIIFIGTIFCLQSALATVSPALESQPQTNCNSCCNGPVGSPGTPGIPGVPGTNGIPGSIAPKGDTGPPGSAGKKGNTGSPGSKGDRGTLGLHGPPGKVGPRGFSGPEGPPARAMPSVKGQKGEIGQGQVSAFSAVRSTSFTASSTQALPFEQVQLNVGDDFDAATGRFTCEISGIYLFTSSFLTYKSNPLVSLMKNNDIINSGYRTIDATHDLVSNSAVVQLDAGDQMWLKIRHSSQMIYSNGNLYTSFSGVILHEM